MRKCFRIILLIIFCSCVHKEDKILTGNAIGESNSLQVFKFPDTVLKNQNTSGEIKYDLELDTLNSLRVNKRYTFLYVTTEKGVFSLEDIKKGNHDSFVDTVGDGTFYFNTKFTNLGQNILSGVIQDVIFTNEFTEGGKVKVIKKNTNISKEVFVK